MPLVLLMHTNRFGFFFRPEFGDDIQQQERRDASLVAYSTGDLNTGHLCTSFGPFDGLDVLLGFLHGDERLLGRGQVFDFFGIEAVLAGLDYPRF